MEKTFQNLITEISNSLSDIKYSLQEKSINYTLYKELNKDFLSFINLKTILTSSKFNFFTDNYINDEEISKKILISPIKGIIFYKINNIHK